MNLLDKLRGKTEMTDETQKIKEVEGKITRVDPKGWGFITSKDIPFTRIFFHWTALRPETKKFTELTNGMKCKFIPIESTFRLPDGNEQKKGIRASKVLIID